MTNAAPAMWKLLILVVVANGTPVLAHRFTGGRWPWPVDFGRAWRDRRPIFGPSKTWRGVLSACLATTLAAPVVGVAPLVGTAAGALAMAGDLAASFVKRRVGFPPSARAPLLDSLPEILLPALVLRTPLGLAWWEVAVAAVVFHGAVQIASPVLYRLNIRRRPW